MGSCFERKISHQGLRHGPDSYGGSSGEYCAMGESLTQLCRVCDEGLRVVKQLRGEEDLTVPPKKHRPTPCQQPR